MDAEQMKQESRRRFISLSGWIIFSLGLIGAIIFAYSAFHSEKLIQIIAKHERDGFDRHDVRQEAHEKTFQAANSMVGETAMLANCIMGLAGVAMVICGLFLGLFRATVPVSVALLIVYLICTVALLLVLGKNIQPLVILVRAGMIFWFSRIVNVALRHARASSA